MLRLFNPFALHCAVNDLALRGTRVLDTKWDQFWKRQPERELEDFRGSKDVLAHDRDDGPTVSLRLCAGA